MIDPVPLWQIFIFFLFLVHDSANLNCFLIFFVQIHGAVIKFVIDITSLSSKSNYNLFLFVSSEPPVIKLLFYRLLMSEDLGVKSCDCKMVFDHQIMSVIIKKPKWVFGPRFGYHLDIWFTSLNGNDSVPMVLLEVQEFWAKPIDVGSNVHHLFIHLIFKLACGLWALNSVLVFTRSILQG